jgi:hypothetical protein
LFPFSENVFVPVKSPVKEQPEILDILFLRELHVSYMDWEARSPSYGECDMDRLGFVSFYSPFLNQFWVAARLVYSSVKQLVRHCPWLILQ